MRKFIIAAALAASALTATAPAAAQWAPPQGQAYGHNNYGQVRRLQVRIDQIQRQIARLDQRDVLSEREARSLRNESRDVERRLRAASRYGLDRREAYSIENRIQRLEYRVQREARDGNRYNRGGWSDRDRDGRNDRYEDDRGTRHD
jgi:hypothetical protein